MMSVSPYIDEEERASQALRASVAEAAMKLGPAVNGWMFDNAVAEEDEEEEKQASTPGLVSSSSSSEDSHFTSLSSQDGHGHVFSRPLISYPTKLAPLSTLEDGYHLNSPFVVVEQNHFPRFPDVPEYPYVPPIDVTDIRHRRGPSSAPIASSQLPVPKMKKPPKGVKFSPKKPPTLSPQSSTAEYTSPRPSPATPARPSNHVDPLSPSITPPSSGSTASPGSSLATPRTPKRLKKILFVGAWKDEDAPVPIPGAQAWDFKDPDRPSFFALQEHGPLKPPPRSASALGHVDVPKGKRAKKAVGTRDPSDGYMSEDTGRAKVRAKEKEKESRSPLKRSMTSRLISKLSNSSVHTGQPEPMPPMPPLPHPIHDRFASIRTAHPEREPVGATKMQGAKNQLSAEGRKALPEDRARSPFLNVYDPSESSSRFNVTTAEPSPSSSTSSFAIIPDLNGLNKRIQQSRHDGRVAASDNEAKLAMLARLITEQSADPVIHIQTPPEGTESGQDVEVPSSRFVVPSPTAERQHLSAVARYQDVLSPKIRNFTSRPPLSTTLKNRRPVRTPTQLHIKPGPTASSEATVSGSAPPTVMNHQIQIRGRQTPFPTKPILPSQGSNLTRSTSQSRLTRNPVLARHPRFLTPKRYDQVQTLPVPGTRDNILRPDVPRSVRSSYSKDLEREEHANEDDDKSVYSQSSRASFMDVGKSTKAREMLVQGVGMVENKEPRWF